MYDFSFIKFYVVFVQGVVVCFLSNQNYFIQNVSKCSSTHFVLFEDFNLFLYINIRQSVVVIFTKYILNIPLNSHLRNIYSLNRTNIYTFILFYASQTPNCLGFQSKLYYYSTISDKIFIHTSWNIKHLTIITLAKSSSSIDDVNFYQGGYSGKKGVLGTCRGVGSHFHPLVNEWTLLKP